MHEGLGEPMSFLQNPLVQQRVVLAQAILVPVATAVVFYVLIDKLAYAKLADAVVALSASVGLAVLGYGLLAWRLSFVLRAFRIRLGWRSLGYVHLTSLFYFFFLPASLGYDLSKGAKIKLRAPQHRLRRIAAATVAERGAAAVGVGLLFFAMLPFARSAGPDPFDWLIVPGWAWPVGIALLLGTAAMAVAWLPPVRTRDLLLLLPPVAISALTYVLIAGGLWIVAAALNLPIGFAAIVVALVGTLLFQLVPLNVLGANVGDVAATTVYLAYGLDKPEAFLLVTVAYVQRLVMALAGGSLEGFGAIRRLRRTPSLEDTG